MKKALIQIFTGALVFLSFLVLLLWLGKQSLSVDSFTLLLVISSLVVITSIWFNITGHWLLGAMLNLNVLALLVAINLASLIGFSSYLFTFSTIWWEAGLEIGRASCRERVQISVVAVSLKKKQQYKIDQIHIFNP